MSVAVILTHGVRPSRETLARALERASLFVCADGAADNARAYGFEPGIIIGDLDSVTSETLASIPDARVLRDTDTETTDTEKAIRHVLAHGGVERSSCWARARIAWTMVGHPLPAPALFRSRADRPGGRSPRAWVAGGTVALDHPPDTVVSFFAVGAPAEGVTTRGLRHPLEDQRLELGVQDSISNVVSERPASVRVGADGFSSSSSRGPSPREAQRHRRPLPFARALEAHGPAHHLDQLLHDHQPQPCSTVLARGGRVALRELWNRRASFSSSTPMPVSRTQTSTNGTPRAPRSRS